MGAEVRIIARPRHQINDGVIGLVRKYAKLSFEGIGSPEKAVVGEVLIQGLDDQVRS